MGVMKNRGDPFCLDHFVQNAGSAANPQHSETMKSLKNCYFIGSLKYMSYENEGTRNQMLFYFLISISKIVFPPMLLCRILSPFPILVCCKLNPHQITVNNKCAPGIYYFQSPGQQQGSLLRALMGPKIKLICIQISIDLSTQMTLSNQEYFSCGIQIHGVNDWEFHGIF